MKAKQLTPQLRFPEFDGEWEEITLGKLFTFKNGLNSDKEKYGSGVKFINVLDIIGEEVITYDSIIGKVEVTDKELEKNEVVFGDILFQRSSETREEVGQANVYVDKKSSAVFGGFVIRGRKKVEYNPYFMNYLLKTSSARKEITTKSGGSTRYNVGQESLSQVFVNLATLPEQQKIASFLTAVDTKLQQLTTKKELLEQYKKGVMQQLFSQQLRFKQDDGSDFGDWEEKKLGEVGKIVSGLTYSPDDIVDEDNGVLVLRSSNVHNGKLSFNDNVYVKVDSFNPVHKDDILICVRNGSKRLIGKNAIIDAESVGLAFGAFMSIYRSKFNNFLFHYFGSEEYNKEVHKNLGATINSINGSDLKKFKVPFPSLKEQEKIASFLSALDAKIEMVQTQLEKTQQFKKGLLQGLFV